MPVQTKTLRLIALSLVALLLLGALLFFLLKSFLLSADERNLARLEVLHALAERAEQAHHGKVIGSVVHDLSGRKVYELMLRTEDDRVLRAQYDLDNGQELSVRELGR